MRLTPLGLALVLTVAALAQEAGPVAELPNIVMTSADGMGEVDFDRKTGRATAQNGVVVKYGSATLTARRIELDFENHIVVAEGDVSVQRLQPDGKAVLWRGERIRYNYVTQTITADQFRFGQPPFFASGRNLEGGRTNYVQTAVDAVVTTDDVAEPEYRVKARTITITSDRVVTAKDATVIVGGVPVMYFPSYSRSLTSHKYYWTVVPGYRNVWGAFGLGAYHQNWNTNLQTAIEVDYYTKRGPGIGPQAEFDLGRWGKGNATFYYIHDQEPGTDALGQPISENRERFSLTHQANPWEDFYTKAVVRQQSDPTIVHDFFVEEYRTDTQPLTFFDGEQLWKNFSLDVLVVPQVNSFQQTVERLPEVKLNGARQQIGNTPFYYDSQTSVGYYEFRSGDATALDYEAFRADTYHQITLPYTLFGWLNLIPRAGARFTHYSDPTGLDALTEAQNRWVFNTGGEVTGKASALWKGVQSDVWDLNGLRHVIQPSVNYTFIPNPNVKPYQVPQFDYRVPSLELRPIEFPDDNSIDTLGYRNVIRLSLFNLLDTKRAGSVQNFVNWQLYTDWNLDKQDPLLTNFSDVYSRLRFQPKTWVGFAQLLRYNTSKNQFDEFDDVVRFTPNDVWSWTFVNRYMVADPMLLTEASNMFLSMIAYRMNENWSVRMTHQYEAKTSTMQAQYYTLERDFRSWVGAATVRIRNNGPNGIDWTVGVAVQLKASPTASQQDKLYGPDRVIEPWAY